CVGASADQAPPPQVPRGMERLAAIWTAPISHYAPPFMHSIAFGYLMSAMLGAGLIVVTFIIIDRLSSGITVKSDQIPIVSGRPGRRPSRFIERTIVSLSDAVERSLFAEQTARSGGLLQRVDPRVKFIGTLLRIGAAAAARNLSVILGLRTAAIVAAVLSRVRIRELVTRVWIVAFAFSGLIALPAVFVTPGRPVWRLPPFGPSITAQGVTSAAFLIARVETAATLTIVLVLCTPWPHLLKAMRVLHVPRMAVLVLGMSYRHVFLMLRTARDMFESRQSRMVGVLDGPRRRHIAAASAGVLLGKSLHLSNEVYAAMLARGFRG